MATKLNDRAFEHAKRLIAEGEVVLDDPDDWSEHQPTAEQENTFIEKHGIGEYGKWYLGIDDAENEDTKAHYKFPYGDFKKVHRCGTIRAEIRAAQWKHPDIEAAAAHLHGMIDAKHERQEAHAR
jgi:hypothetical protein